MCHGVAPFLPKGLMQAGAAWHAAQFAPANPGDTMHIRTEFARFTLFTALGFSFNACSASNSDDNVSENQTQANNSEVNKPKPQTRPSACGDSTTYTEYPGSNELEVCANGLVHRPSSDVTCTSKLEGLAAPYQPFPSAEDECTKHNDCSAHAYGFCELPSGCLGGSFLQCKYGCLTDSDCDDGEVCRCGSPIGECVSSDCSEDADCGEGYLCQLVDGGGFRCQQPEDECAVYTDCPEESGIRGSCLEDGDRLKCFNVVCGRPFLVSGSARLAPSIGQPFAHTAGAPSLVGCDELSTETREHLGRHWAAIGLMEHASIAAFARFALQLMHLGAPSHFLVAAQHAMLDETAHASTCFGIATRLLGRPVGPGTLPMDNALTETKLADIVRLTIREGCIGETVAALEAAEAAAACSEPHIKASLLTIQADELRHAELAWRFVQWALGQSDSETSPGELASLVAEEFRSALSACDSSESPAPERDAAVAASYGVLGDSARREVRRAALERVIAPCARELLASGRSKLAQHRSLSGEVTPT